MKHGGGGGGGSIMAWACFAASWLGQPANNEFWIIPANSKEKRQDILSRIDSRKHGSCSKTTTPKHTSHSTKEEQS